jgi:hypothetical protein
MLLQFLKTVKLTSVFVVRQNTNLIKPCICHLLHIPVIIRRYQAAFATKYKKKAHQAEGVFFTVNTLQYIILYT